jgi:hypothetical protein
MNLDNKEEKKTFVETLGIRNLEVKQDPETYQQLREYDPVLQSTTGYTFRKK